MKSEELHPGATCLDKVVALRGKWVIKLAVALYLSGKNLPSVDELTKLHSELWRSDCLGEESRRLGYASPDLPLRIAEFNLRKSVALMYEKSGFEACMSLLEPYFERQFMRHATMAGFGANKSGPLSAFVGIDSGISSWVTKMAQQGKLQEFYTAVVNQLRFLNPSTSEQVEGYVSSAELLALLKKCVGCDLTVFDGDNNMLFLILQRLDLIGQLQFRQGCTEVSSRGESDSQYDAVQQGANLRDDGAVLTRVRAAWAHEYSSLSFRVLSSHPTVLLHEFLDHFQKQAVLYDFIEKLED
ncbi:hypothetical protein TRVL_01443 [Trypanosoma vivax]|nr:hypothetical protein TRVL_01443 [Trypanosoma vivax]